MLGSSKLRKTTSLATAAVGAFALIAPGKAAVLGDKLSLSTRYENVGQTDLVPRDWYVDATRATGAGMLAAGLTGFLVAVGNDQSAAASESEPAVDDDAVTDEEADAEVDDGPVDVIDPTDDGPVEIDLDDAEDPADD